MEKTQKGPPLRKSYQDKFELCRTLKEVALGDLTEILKQHGIPTNNVLGRVKTFESFRKKALDGIAKGIFANPIEEMFDLVGLRIILIFIDDLEKIAPILSPTFKIVSTEHKGQKGSYDVFGYDSDHYVLEYDKVLGPRYEELKGLKFELQVRTILMDGWASLSHEIDYKTNSAVPSNLRRVFFGLSGMFAVADKTFQDLRNASKENYEKVTAEENTIQKIIEQEINLDTLKVYLNLKFPSKWKEQEGWEGNDQKYSEFIEEIKKVGGYSTIKDIDEAVEAVLPAEQEIEPILSKNNAGKPFHLVGTLRAVFDIFDDKYFSRISENTSFVWVQQINKARSTVGMRKSRK